MPLTAEPMGAESRFLERPRSRMMSGLRLRSESGLAGNGPSFTQDLRMARESFKISENSLQQSLPSAFHSKSLNQAQKTFGQGMFGVVDAFYTASAAGAEVLGFGRPVLFTVCSLGP